MSPRWSVAIAGVSIAVSAALVTPVFTGRPSLHSTAWYLTAAIIALGPLVLVRRERLIGMWLYFILIAYVGMSAHVAVRDLTEAPYFYGSSLMALKAMGIGVEAPHSVDAPTAAAFVTAARVAYLCSLAALLTCVAFPGRQRPPRTTDPDISFARLMLAGRIFLVIGVIGVVGALARFFATGLGQGSIWDSAKSFWDGGAYLLAAGHLVLPGCACIMQARAARGDSWRQLMPAMFGMLTLTVLLIPTGQRTFGLESGVVALMVLAGNGRLRPRTIATTLILGLVLLGVTQAARDQVRETGKFTAAGTVDRLLPAKWTTLYANQFSSFTYIVDVIHYDDSLDTRNSLVSLLTKPIPRQILPDKSQGFAAEFTARLYPAAADEKVNFATPAMAELRADLGTNWGVIAAFALFGTVLAALEHRIRRGLRILAPLLAIAMFWSAYAVVRGDLANGALLVANWVFPFGIVAYLVSRPPRPRRIVIDALQVAPTFSGIGRMVLEIGQQFRAAPDSPPLTVRCARDVEATLREAFPPGTTFEVPLASSHPRLRRLAYQQLIRPLRESGSTLMVCPGDQAPVWGGAAVVLICFDVRRLVDPAGTSRAELLLYRLLVPASVRRARVVLTASEFSKAEIERVCRPRGEVVAVAHHPTAPRVGNGDPRAPRAPAHFLSVGALRPYKGVEQMIRALGKLPSSPQRSLRIVGAGEGQLDHLKTVAADGGVAEDVTFEGWVSEDRLADLYRGAIAVLNASSYEGYGLPVAEGLASGAPVIASDIPPHREVAGDAAEFFTAGDVDDLAATMQRLLDDPARAAELARAGPKRVRELAALEPSWRTAIQTAFEEWRSAGERGHPRGG